MMENEVVSKNFIEQIIDKDLAEGIYDIEASLAGHRPVTKQIEVIVGVPQTIELRPTPIYGMLDVNSNPMGANITINGKSISCSTLYIFSNCFC